MPNTGGLKASTADLSSSRGRAPRTWPRTTDACCVWRDVHICCGNPSGASQGFGVQKDVLDELLDRIRGGDAEGEHGGRYVASRDDCLMNRFVCRHRGQQRLPSLKGMQQFPKLPRTKCQRVGKSSAKPVCAQTHPCIEIESDLFQDSTWSCDRSAQSCC